MADSMCGPSNALQTFQKHSTADRTLQQDRLTSRQTPSQGFRSTGPTTGVLDPEFEAFQAGQFPLHAQEQQAFQQQALQQHGFANRGHPQLGQAGPSNWTNDFQRMNIANPSPHQQHFSGPPQQQGAWHEEFARQGIQQGGQNHMLGHNSAQERLSMLATGPMMGGYQPIQPMWNSTAPMQPQQQQLPANAVEAFDEEAFKRAFDEAAVENVDTREQVMLDESAEQLLARDLAQQERIGADMIHDPDAVNERHIQEQPDALSKTAGELLLRVQDNKSDKFQNSQFLQLMRQLRDKEVVVQGDKIVGVDESSVENQLRRLSHELHFPGLKHIAIDETGLKSMRWQDRLRFGSAVRHIMFVLVAIQSLLQMAGLDEIITSGIGHFVHALESNHVMSLCPGLHSLTLTIIEMLEGKGFYSDSESRSKALSLLRSEKYTSSMEYTGEEVEEILRKWLSANDIKDSNSMDLLPAFEELDTIPGQGRLDRMSRKDILGPDVHAIVSTLSHRKWNGRLSDERFIKMVGTYRSEIAFEDSKPGMHSNDPWKSLLRGIARSRAPNETQRLLSFGKIVEVNHARWKELVRRNDEALDRSRQDITDLKSQNVPVGRKQRNRLNQQTGFLLTEEVNCTEGLGTEKTPAMLNPDQIKFLQTWLENLTTDKQSRFWVLSPDQLLELLGAENYIYGQRPSPENLTTLQKLFGLECLVSMHWLSSSWSRTPIDIAEFLKIMRAWELKDIPAFVRENHDTASKKISKQSERFYRKVAHYRSFPPKIEDVLKDIFYDEAESQPQDQAFTSLEQGNASSSDGQAPLTAEVGPKVYHHYFQGRKDPSFEETFAVYERHVGPAKFEGLKSGGGLSMHEYQKQIMLLELQSRIRYDMLKTVHDDQVYLKDREIQEKSRQGVDPDTGVYDLGSQDLPEVRIETEQEGSPLLTEIVVQPSSLNLLAKDDGATQKESAQGAQAIQESFNDITNDSTTGNDMSNPTMPKDNFKFDASGKMWFTFPQELDGVKMEYTLLGDISLDAFQDGKSSSLTIKQENLIYPQANCEKDAYKGTRWEYENCCNTIGLFLLQANPMLHGKRGLTLAAVKNWEACCKVALEEFARDGTQRGSYLTRRFTLQDRDPFAYQRALMMQEEQRFATARIEQTQDKGQSSNTSVSMPPNYQASEQMRIKLDELQNKKILAMTRAKQALTNAQSSNPTVSTSLTLNAHVTYKMLLKELDELRKKWRAESNAEQVLLEAESQAQYAAQKAKSAKTVAHHINVYQEQLDLLERQNKKRLALARKEQEYMDRVPIEVLLLKQKLQKGLMSFNEPPKEEEMAQMSEYISKLENEYSNIGDGILRTTMIHEVFKAILELPEIPLENEYHFKDRCNALLKKWHSTLAKAGLFRN